jgi:hypothetical protein
VGSERGMREPLLVAACPRSVAIRAWRTASGYRPCEAEHQRKPLRTISNGDRAFAQRGSAGIIFPRSSRPDGADYSAGQTASASSSWRARACLDRLSLAVSRSRTSAT